MCFSAIQLFVLVYIVYTKFFCFTWASPKGQFRLGPAQLSSLALVLPPLRQGTLCMPRGTGNSLSTSRRRPARVPRGERSDVINWSHGIHPEVVKETGLELLSLQLWHSFLPIIEASTQLFLRLFYPPHCDVSTKCSFSSIHHVRKGLLSAKELKRWNWKG